MRLPVASFKIFVIMLLFAAILPLERHGAWAQTSGAGARGFETLEEVRQRIIEQNLCWTAGRTSVSDRGPEAFQRMLGLRIPPEVKERFEKLTSEYQPLGLTFPSFFSWRQLDGMTPVRDQGSCGSCWDFAALGALESMIKIYWGIEYDLSEQQVLSCASPGWGCGGGWMGTAWAHLRDNGAVLESCMPYIGVDTAPCVEATCTKYAAVDRWEDVPNNIEAIKNKVMNHGPVATTFTVYEDFQYYNGGCYEHPGNDPINHAVVIVGWDDAMCNGAGAWVVKNSWGEDWGKSGYFWIKYGTCRIGSYSQVVYHYAGVDISFMEGTLADSQGDGLVDPGEAMTLDVTLWNEILAPHRTGIAAALACSNPLVAIHNAQSSYPDLDPAEHGASYTPYLVSFQDWMPEGTTVKFALNITADGGYAASDTFFMPWPRIRTPYHYVSPTGGNVYPYRTPANAAHTITGAINAADDGDSIYVVSGTFAGASFIVDRGVSVFGGWNGDFSARNLESGKTVIDLSGDVLFSSPDSMAVLDGFILQNGEGAYQVVPFHAYFGGGARIYDGRACIANCEIRSNAANANEADLGIGGGVFAMNSAVVLRNNHIWGNTAHKGGGVYLYRCNGLMENNVISDNELSVYASSSALGSGVYLDECAGMNLAGNTIEHNLGAFFGAGLYADTSIAVNVSGGAISRNSSARNGGGVFVTGGSIVFDAVEFLRNATLLYGGEIRVKGGASAVIADCRFLWNSAAIGAGICAQGGACSVRHGLFIGNDGSGSAAYFENIASGEFVGNTIDRSNAHEYDGSVSMFDCGVPIFNNIITNTNGLGLQAFGSVLPAARYNNVWNNSAGSYEGCSPGEGSLSVDPLYADTASADYHLLVHSPAIDAGDTSSSCLDPDGSRGDMGCYGSHAHAMIQPSYPKNLESSVASGMLTLRWSKNPETDVEYYAVYRDTTESFIPCIENFLQFIPSTDTSFAEPYTNGVSYRVSAVDSSGYGSGYSRGAHATATAAPDIVAWRFELHQNVPNPFNPSTTIAFELDRPSNVVLAVYDVQGRIVRRLLNEPRAPGMHRHSWNGKNDAGSPVASGIYFCKLTAGDRTRTRKMVLLK